MNTATQLDMAMEDILSRIVGEAECLNCDQISIGARTFAPSGSAVEIVLRSRGRRLRALALNQRTITTVEEFVARHLLQRGEGITVYKGSSPDGQLSFDITWGGEKIRESGEDESSGSYLMMQKRSELETARILLVEDDLDQREILHMVLAGAGFEIVEATHGQMALEILAETAIDLILTDLNMPVMNGLELVKEIREQPQLVALPVIILTVMADADREIELLEAGANDFCSKSVDRKVLLSRINKVLQK